MGMQSMGDKENKGMVQNWLKYFTFLVHLVHFPYTINEYPCKMAPEEKI